MKKNYKSGNPEVILMLPLPIDLSMAIKSCEIGWIGINDKSIKMASVELIDQFKFQILGGGVKNNTIQFQVNDKSWDKIKRLAALAASGNAGFTYTILTDLRYRIHLEALRMITGYSLMDILYHGEINVHNELNEADNKLYLTVCNKIWTKLNRDPQSDITKLALKDLHQQS
jgi:hypothetical protein